MFSAGIVGILLATLPGSIERSTAGFGDRDAWCLMIGILLIIIHLVSLQVQHARNKILWTIASGLTVFLGGLSWEGFGVFLSVILVVEFGIFITSETQDRLKLYALWVLTFVPTLYLASPAYRSGYGFAKHLFAFMLGPPLVLLGIRWLRHLLLLSVEKLRPQANMLVSHKPAQHFLGGELSDAFVPVYPIDDFAEADVNVWKINYPIDIKTNLKYLRTDFSEIDCIYNCNKHVRKHQDTRMDTQKIYRHTLSHARVSAADFLFIRKKSCSYRT